MTNVQEHEDHDHCSCRSPADLCHNGRCRGKDMHRLPQKGHFETRCPCSAQSICPNGAWLRFLPYGTPCIKKCVLSLAALVPDLCFMCHDKAKFSKKNIHPPVAGGDCLTCHNPHSSDAPKLLPQQIRLVCQNCHPDRTNGKHILGGYGFGDNHPIMGPLDPSRRGQELGRSSCHNPHSSGKKALLVNDEPNSPENFCLLCHTKITVRH